MALNFDCEKTLQYWIDSAENQRKRKGIVNKLDAEQSEKNIKLTDVLEDLDDVQEVFTNAELDQSVFT